jgi:CheY-like chemotaxis protein
MLSAMARILIAEADSDVRTLMARVVGRMGHEAVAYAGAGALPQVDAALVEPSGAHGCAALEALARRRRSVPVVLVSVASPGATARRVGAVAHVRKPFALPSLEGALRLALAAASHA